MERMEQKEQIRKEHLAERKELQEIIAEENSLKISKILQEYFAVQKELQVLGVYGYYPLGNEVSLLHLYTWLLKQQVPLAFPRVSGDTMEFYQVTSFDAFSEGAFHILEPVKECRKAAYEKAFCLVPGSVFDENGNRYGYGKGYYDRYFSVHKGLRRIGIAYEMQVENQIPAEQTDIRMQMLATETGIRFF